MPSECHLLALFGRIDLFQRFAAVEIMVELDEVAIAQFPRVQIIVFDVLGDERTTDGAGRFIAVSTEPLAEALQLFTRVDGGKRRWDPAGFQRVRGISTATAGDQTEFLTRFQNGSADFFLFSIGTPDFEARCAGHAVTQRADGFARNVHGRHVEELELLKRSAMQLFNDGPSVRTLDLEAPFLAGNGLAHRTHRRPVIQFDFDVIATSCRVITKPVGGRRTADISEALFFFPEDDAIADDMAIRRRRNILLGLVD